MEGYFDHNTDMDNEIEHWCPVCDRQIVPTFKPVLAPADLSQGHHILSQDHLTPAPSQDVTESEVATAPTTTTQQKKRLLTGGPAGRGSRINLHRSKTANGHPYGRRKSGTTENLNLLIQDLIPDLNGGTASKSRTSPDGGSDPITSGQDIGAELNAEAPGGGGVNSNTDVNIAELRRPLRRGNSDRALDSHNRNQASEKSTATKRRSTGQEVLLPLARVKSTVKSKNGPKPKAKTLNLITANLNAAVPKDAAPSVSASTKASPAGINIQPVESPIPQQHILDDPRRRLYCSDECYNIDIGKASLPTPPQTEGEERRLPPKKQLTYEMPWYRAMDTTGETYGFRSMQQIYHDESEDDQLEMNLSRTPISPTASSPKHKRRSAHFHHERALSSGAPEPMEQVHEIRRKVHRRDTSHSLPAPVSLYSPTSPTKPSPLSARRDSGPQPPLYFRRMPGALEITAINEGPTFTINGRRTTHQPAWFDYGAYLQVKESERRRKQRELNDHLEAGYGKTAEQQALAKRKARLMIERKKMDAKRQEIVGYSNEEDIDPNVELPWWRIDEREDWRTYWDAREGGLELSFEDWQVRRHKERVDSVLKKEKRERLVVDLGLVKRGDARRVKDRPLLIRVASQPTLSDHRVTDKVEGKRKVVKRTDSSSAGSEVTSPLELGQPKPLPSLQDEDSSALPSEDASSMLTMSQTLPRRKRLASLQGAQLETPVTPVTNRWSTVGQPTSPLATHSFIAPGENSVKTVRRKPITDSPATRNNRTLPPLIIKAEATTASPTKPFLDLPLQGSPDTSVPPSGVNSGSSGEESNWSSAESHGVKRSPEDTLSRPPLPTRESIDSIDPPTDILTEGSDAQPIDSGLAWLLKACSERVSSLPNATIRGKLGFATHTTVDAPTSRAEKRRSLWEILGSTNKP